MTKARDWKFRADNNTYIVDSFRRNNFSITIGYNF